MWIGLCILLFSIVIVLVGTTESEAKVLYYDSDVEDEEEEVGEEDIVATGESASEEPEDEELEDAETPKPTPKVDKSLDGLKAAVKENDPNIDDSVKDIVNSLRR